MYLCSCESAGDVCSVQGCRSVFISDYLRFYRQNIAWNATAPNLLREHYILVIASCSVWPSLCFVRLQSRRAGSRSFATLPFQLNFFRFCFNWVLPCGRFARPCFAGPVWLAGWQLFPTHFSRCRSDSKASALRYRRSFRQWLRCRFWSTRSSLVSSFFFFFFFVVFSFSALLPTADCIAIPSPAIAEPSNTRLLPSLLSSLWPHAADGARLKRRCFSSKLAGVETEIQAASAEAQIILAPA